MNLAVITANNLNLITDSLKISLMTAEDWSAFLSLQSDEELMKKIGPVLPENEIRTKFEDRIRSWKNEEEHWITLIINDKETNKFIGSIGFKFQSIDHQRVEIGYLVLQEFNGQGYITEAGKAITSFLLEQVKVRKIVAYCEPTNIGSWKVMEKLNFQREALLKSDNYFNGKWRDSYSYGLVNADSNLTN